MRSRPRASAASRVFIVFLGAAFAMAALLAVLLTLDAGRSERAAAETLTLSLARTIATTPTVVDAMREPDGAATALLEPVAREITDATPLDFVTIMRPDGIRLTHPDPAQIGQRYLGTIAAAASGGTITEEFTGTLGPSVRSVVPVLDGSSVVGLVSVGVTVGNVWSQVWGRLPFIVTIAAALAATGAAAAWLARRATRRVAGDLPASAVRDAVSSYESVRTLGEALRAQTHEHGNRMHTAVALIELGRGDEAVELLTETARTSQELVDQVVASDGDPTVAALMLGKASQAKERGVEWIVDMQPGIPRTTLGPVDAVSLVGNLIDNAIDAAAGGPEPRWVRVRITAPTPETIVMSFADSGAGIPEHVRERIFDHGFSTKPAGAEGRGVGLALVREIVDDAGGSLEVTANPTTFRVTLPARRTP